MAAAPFQIKLHQQIFMFTTVLDFMERILFYIFTQMGTPFIF